MTSGSGLEDDILCIILAGETWPWPCSPFIGGEHDIGDGAANAGGTSKGKSSCEVGELALHLWL